MSRRVSLIGLVLGLSLISLLLIWSGLAKIVDILTAAGWSLLLVLLLSPPEAFLASEAWRRLFPKAQRPGIWSSLKASWMGNAVNTLLPVATVGGEVVKARVLTLGGVSATDATAATIVDKTVQAIAILIWGMIGLVVLASLAPSSGILWGGLVGAAALALGIAGFIALQLRGSFSFLATAASRLLTSAKAPEPTAVATTLDQTIRSIYQHPRTIAEAVLLRLGSQVWLVSEVLLTTYLLGHAVGLEDAIMLRALIGAVRGLSFVVPAGLGLQEGAYIALGALIGMSADVMLALSLASRLREIGSNLPFLLLWQQLEGRRLWHRYSTKTLTNNATA